MSENDAIVRNDRIDGGDMGCFCALHTPFSGIHGKMFGDGLGSTPGCAVSACLRGLLSCAIFGLGRRRVTA